MKSALVKFNNGELERPVVKLAPVFQDSIFTSENGPEILTPETPKISKKMKNKAKSETFKLKFRSIMKIYLRFRLRLQ